MPTPIMLGPTGRHPRGSQRAVSFDAYDVLAGVRLVLMVLSFFAVSEILIQGERMVTGVRRAHAHPGFPFVRRVLASQDRRHDPVDRGLAGGAPMAIMLGVFQIHGMEPEPPIFATSKELV